MDIVILGSPRSLRYSNPWRFVEPKIYYLVPQVPSLPLIPIVRQIQLVHAGCPFSLKIHFNFVVVCMPRLVQVVSSPQMYWP
jgi:hypothetical protein